MGTMVMRKRILVVDDDPVMARATARILGREYDVLTVDSGADALRALEQGGFSGIVSDVDMPGMSGPELYANIERLYPAMVSHFVFFTANESVLPTFDVPVILKGTGSKDVLRRVQGVT
jgi:CheY-like chemotaxis protein